MHACMASSTQRQPRFAGNCVCISWRRCPLQSRSLRAVQHAWWVGVCACSHTCSFPGPLPPSHPLHALPGGLQPTRPFTTRLSLRLPGPFLSFYLPLLGQFNPKYLKVEIKGRSKIKLKHEARESASGGGGEVCPGDSRTTGLQGFVPPRTSPPRGGAGQRPPDGAEKVQLSGIRGISGESKKVTQESASRAVASPPPHTHTPAPYQLQAGSPPHLHSPAPQALRLRPPAYMAIVTFSLGLILFIVVSFTDTMCAIAFAHL